MKGARAAAAAALVVVAATAVLTAREVALGQAEVTAADTAAARSDWGDAVVHARAAAEALVPGSPWPARGWSRLEAIGHDAEARGDDATALLAYGAMRSAALATRAPGAGSDRWRSKAEDALARVASYRKEVGAPVTPAASMLDALHETEPPPTGTLALLALAAAAMLGGLGRLAWVGTGRAAQVLAALGLVAYAVVLLMT
ncbi:MAG TPA: hypothetical protein VGL81_36155 [Polyangiaceae bacterium]|jgi:hypothetical protein